MAESPTSPVRSAREELRQLFDGDMLFFHADPGGGGGDPDPPADPPADPPVDPAPPPEGDPDDPGGAGDPPEKLTPEAARKLRSEAQSLRTRLREAERERDELARKDLSEKERLERDIEDREKRASELETRERTLLVRVAAVSAGVRADATAAAAALVDWTEIEDASDEKQVVRALKALKSDHPYLFTSTDVDAGRKHNGNGGDEDVTPGAGRLRHAYSETATT